MYQKVPDSASARRLFAVLFDSFIVITGVCAIPAAEHTDATCVIKLMIHEANRYIPRVILEQLFTTASFATST
jgi:hypothetical protein